MLIAACSLFCRSACPWLFVVLHWILLCLDASRIERDFSTGEVIQFYPSMPPELEGRLASVDFSETINDINTILLSAQARGWALFDNALMLLTFYLSPYILGTRYHRQMKHLVTYLDTANASLFRPAGLNLVDPMKTAYLFLEIEYY